MAACVSMVLQRWIRALVREWRRRAGAWRPLVWAREEPQESCCFLTPSSSKFNPKDNKATSPIPEEFEVVRIRFQFFDELEVQFFL